ncbi:MAG TPA: helicase-related protein, partial [Miltoncostaeaceae bacterium]|nr:helicase-related protein [Miltoncostaeaceae bacterium]
RRFALGELLGDISRHLLLMTATPHNGNPSDFQVFLSLLDRDRFAGRYRPQVHSDDTTGLMRRMVKEDLLTFEGKPLFPERIAETVPYRLTAPEMNLYRLVTEYVKDEMNRADALGGARQRTVGFALTVLQRRLASSPAAIHRSLVRRAERLERRRQDLLAGRAVVDPPPVPDRKLDEVDDDDFAAAELEQREDELVDAATAARTAEELEVEIRALRGLIAVAQNVLNQAQDRKWEQLSTILHDEVLAARRNDGARRKLIVFTEHRDTLEYLQQRIAAQVGRPEAVVTIHGGVARAERRRVTEEFTHNPACFVLVATDAAGEGLNLQAAHLMVNYDLPWNPNRIEQRFGRIHRIGQRHVCRLWNLVAEDTREGDVFQRLLSKVEEQRRAYGGKVFDVLGEAFEEYPLRGLLLDAIRYGDDPARAEEMNRVIDSSVARGIDELLRERAIASPALSESDLGALRERMDEARARRLQPHYIEAAFREAFRRLDGRLRRREAGRFEILNVPAAVRERRRGAPIATRYERITFDPQRVEHPGAARAELIAPGHPLHDAVIEATLERWGALLERGAVLVSSSLSEPHLLVGLRQEVRDSTGAAVAGRFSYAYVARDGTVTEAGPAPYLDCVGADAATAQGAQAEHAWLAEAERRARSWLIAEHMAQFEHEATARRRAELERVRDQVNHRLIQERERLSAEAVEAGQQARAGGTPRRSAATLDEQAAELERRRVARLALLERQLSMHPLPPAIVTAALVLPAAAGALEPAEGERAPAHAVPDPEVERRGVERVMAVERALARTPVEQAFNNPGFDILSRPAHGDPLRIEVKARVAGADGFFITHNEVVTGLNSAPRYRLALVSVDPRGPAHDAVRYIDEPFTGFDAGGFDVAKYYARWDEMWARGRDPF